MSSGGLHLSLYPGETLAFEDVDFVVFGEGELTFNELVQTLQKHSEGTTLDATLRGVSNIQN